MRENCQYNCFQENKPRLHWANNPCTEKCTPCPNLATRQLAGIQVCERHAKQMIAEADKQCQK